MFPSHARGFFDVIQNRSSEVPLLSQKSLLSYPRLFLTDYSPHPWIGGLVLAGAALSLLRIGGRSPASRIVPLALATGLVAVTLHPYKHPRFLFPVAPMIWLAFAQTTVDGLAGLARRIDRRILDGLALVTSVVLVLAVMMAGIDRPELERRLRGETAQDARACLDGIVEELSRHPEAMVLGLWKDLSPALLEWEIRRLHPGRADSLLPIPFRHLREMETRAAVQSLAEESPRILIVELPGDDPRSREHTQENHWLGPLHLEIRRHPGFVFEGTRAFPPYRLTVYAPLQSGDRLRSDQSSS